MNTPEDRRYHLRRRRIAAEDFRLAQQPYYALPETVLCWFCGKPVPWPLFGDVPGLVVACRDCARAPVELFPRYSRFDWSGGRRMCLEDYNWWYRTWHKRSVRWVYKVFGPRVRRIYLRSFINPNKQECRCRWNVNRQPEQRRMPRKPGLFERLRRYLRGQASWGAEKRAWLAARRRYPDDPESQAAYAKWALLHKQRR